MRTSRLLYFIFREDVRRLPYTHQYERLLKELRNISNVLNICREKQETELCAISCAGLSYIVIFMNLLNDFRVKWIGLSHTDADTDRQTPHTPTFNF